MQLRAGLGAQRSSSGGRGARVCLVPRAAPERAAVPKLGLPEVDWSRYHLQVLFIDTNDVLRARLAAALFERVAEWNGFGRVLLPWTCGVDADQGAPCGDLNTQAGLMFRAAELGLRPKIFTKPTERFEAADLDRHDVIVALDRATKDAVLRLVDPRFRDYYDEHVRLLSEYGSGDLLQDSKLLRKGGLALLPRDISSRLGARAAALPDLRSLVDVPRPDLTADSPGAAAAFEDMTGGVMVCVAGLASYLMDSYPDDLPHWDPL